MREFTTRENQELIFIPTNSISDTIWWISEDNKNNQRLIVDVPSEHPNVWQISKVEKINVKGRTKLTLYQHEYNEHTDFIEKDNNGNIIGMWADYYAYNIEPQEEQVIDGEEKYLSLSASTNTLKVGGSYKTIKAIMSDESDILSTSWSAYIDGVLVPDDLLTWKEETPNEIKVKIANNRKYLGKMIEIRCTADDISSSIFMEISI